MAGDRLAVDLVGAVVDAGGAREAVHLLERQVGRVAERAVHLERAVDDVVQHAGAEELDHRHLGARRAGALGVHHPGRVQRHQPRRLHLRGAVGDPVLDRLLVRQHRAVRVAVGGALAHHVEGAPRHPEPAHAVVDAPRDEPVLGEDEALALAAEQRLARAGGRPRRALRRARRRSRSAPTGAPSWARRARSWTPGVSTGTMNIEARWEGRASGSVTAIRIRKSAIEPLEVNHLRPSITHSSPSRRALRAQLRGVRARACPARSC